MKKENNNNVLPYGKAEKTRYWSVIGFLASITVLSIAFFISINQEEIDSIATQADSESKIANTTLIASSELSKTINEVVTPSITSINNTSIQNETVNEIAVETTEINSPTFQNNSETTLNTSDEVENLEELQDSSDENVENDEVNSSHFIKPIDGEIYKEFSMDSLVYSDTLQEWVTHRGIDIKADMSAEVRASADGTIKSIKNDPRYGLSVTIEHKDGFCTIYTCLVNADMIKEGDSVEQGQVIGKVGNSGIFEVSDGSHLHFEMTQNGTYINPDIYIK